ncbi:MAG: alcohol dehydrogenase class IV [Kiritimatiellia bacterium]
MPSKVPIWTLDQLKALPAASTVLCTTPSCRDRVRAVLPFVEAPPEAGQTLIVVGGGGVMDEWKAHRPDAGYTLVCVPSIYGSGAEVSPVVVLNRPSGKDIQVAEYFKPDARVYWPELLQSVPAAQARDACGDVWSHALEAFISPLADEALRGELAELINELVDQPLEADPAWFELSARACELQSRCGVGVIHGIAHTLEPVLNDPKSLGHAALCAILLWPVLRYNREHAEKWTELVYQFDLDEAAIEIIARDLFDPERFERVRSLMSEHWKSILRDPCTRTNGVLVRRNHLDYFLNTAFA